MTEEICRVCLQKNNNKRRLSNDGVEQNDIFNKFLILTNLEIKEDEAGFICSLCESKLIFSFNFREQCLESDDLIRQSSQVIILNSLIKDKTSEDETETVPFKQTMRLAQFNYDEVQRAIDKVKARFYQSTECGQCSFKTSNKRALSSHISRVHKDIKSKWCFSCNTLIEDLAIHSELHKSNEGKCELCGKAFPSTSSLLDHLRSHTRTRPYVCSICKRSYISTRHLAAHIHRVHVPFKCEICLGEFGTKRQLSFHLRNHSDRENNKNNVKINFDGYKTKFDRKNVVQNYCSKCERKVRSLSKHLLQFHGDNAAVSDPKVLCNVCGKTFKSASKLRVHMRIHTDERPYKCSFCEKQFYTRYQQTVHERTHTGEKPHCCSICGKAFSQTNILKNHMKIHTGGTELCTICDRKFCTPAELRLHLRKHSGEKPFLCTECGKGFAQCGHLTEHMMVHRDLRPFACDLCEKAFKRKSTLTKHKLVHLDEKPFKCSQCSYSCRQSYYLNQHMLQHDSDQPLVDRPYNCRICNKNYTTDAALRSHYEFAHQCLIVSETE